MKGKLAFDKCRGAEGCKCVPKRACPTICRVLANDFNHDLRKWRAMAEANPRLAKEFAEVGVEISCCWVWVWGVGLEGKLREHCQGACRGGAEG